MPGLPFTLRQLEIFENLCNSRSFRRTSEDLGISQAAVSNQIKALEDQMGVRLLFRDSGRPSRLTPEGAAFLADLGQFWDTALALASHRRSHSKQEAAPPRSLRILVGNYLLNDCIKPKLSQFFEDHPDIEFDFVSPTIEDLPQEMIERDDYDLGLFQERHNCRLQPGMRNLALVRCGVFGHRSFLGDSGAALTAKEASGLPFVLPPINSPYENLILTMLAEGGVKPGIITGRTQYFDVMSSILERGGSVGVMIEPLLRKNHGSIALLYPLEDWRLIFYRNPRGRKQDSQVESVENFLISAVLDDSDYPRIRPSPGTRLEAHETR